MTTGEIKELIRERIEKVKWTHYDNPNCQRLVTKQRRALEAAVRAIERSEELQKACTDAWAKNLR